MIRRVSRGGTLVAALALLAPGGTLLAEQGWLAAKAFVAARLIERAFVAHLRDGGVHLPWSWADTHPVAQLEVPRLALRRTVLAGASGSSLAFGVGHLDGTAQPNEQGSCALAGHRDSWFAFLAQLRVGDELLLHTRSGVRRYRVEQLAVHGMRDTRIFASSAETRLLLITCYPFGSLRESPWRYVVTARPARSRKLVGQATGVLAQPGVDAG